MEQEDLFADGTPDVTSGPSSTTPTGRSGSADRQPQRVSGPASPHPLIAEAGALYESRSADITGTASVAATIATAATTDTADVSNDSDVAHASDSRSGSPLAGVHLGTSSWSFPGWRGLVYGDAATSDGLYPTRQLAHDGLAAYSAQPLLRTVGIDRSFYAPLEESTYRHYASQVTDDFRFMVKAPASVCDAAIRGRDGTPTRNNPDFLDPDYAWQKFVTPCLSGLGRHAGPLVFQLSPLPDALLADPARLIGRLDAFFSALPALAANHTAPDACYALEIRDAALLTPRLIKMLHARGVRYCVGLHSRMPDIARQTMALAALDALELKPPNPLNPLNALAGTAEAPRPTAPVTPLIVRWSLHAGLRYEGAKARYAPFDAIVDPDLATREALAALIRRYVRAGQRSFIVINNKAEGSSPLSCALLAKAIAAIGTPS